MFKGEAIQFCNNTHKAISNYEIDISGKIGIVTDLTPDSIVVKLEGHVLDLELWNNELIWCVEDCLFGDNLNNWELLSDGERVSFFRGFLANIVTQGDIVSRVDITGPSKHRCEDGSGGDGDGDVSHEDMRFELIQSFSKAIAMVRKCEPGDDKAVSLHVKAFYLARVYGWDTEHSSTFQDYCQKASEEECLAEGLRMALYHCKPEGSPTLQERWKTTAKDLESILWERMAESFPEAETGCFGPTESVAFMESIKEATRLWLSYNHPNLQHDDATEGWR